LYAVKKTNPPSKHDQVSTLVEKYKRYLNEHCKVSFHFYTDQDSKVLKWHDLTGPEKYKPFSKIQIPQEFPSLPQCSKVQDIWSGFFKINKLLKSEDFDSEKISCLICNIRNWFIFFYLFIKKTCHTIYTFVSTPHT